MILELTWMWQCGEWGQAWKMESQSYQEGIG
jgi:hypothetical protein